MTDNNNNFKSSNSDLKIGVYVCHCGKNIAGVVDVDEVTEYAKKLPNVVIAKNYKFMCSKNGQQIIADDIKAGLINRVVVASCSPLMHEETFRRVLRENNLNEFYFEQANIREQASWVTLYDPKGATEIAKDHVQMSVAKVSNNLPLERQKLPITQEILVIGGGITGIFAALDLANKYKVYLVEKSPTIGGHMAQLDKTFPTMDCSACITTPKMVEVGRHPNIKLITYAEVTNVDLTVGNFKVQILQKAKKVNQDLCTGCGSCAEVCPVTTGNEFDLNMSHRGAVYIPFPQAVPSKYLIDSNACIECKLCEKACEVGAIDFSDKDKIIDIKVGAIIIATGYEPIDPSNLTQYGYHKYKNVITALEMERLLSSYGPTLGKIVRPSDHKPPKSMAFVQCVGSRDFHEGFNKYCSRVCCMYAIKQARQFKEKYPDAEVYIIYMDIRSFGKGYEEFYEIAAREYGIKFIRGRVGDVYEEIDKSLTLRVSDTFLGEIFELKVDLLVLSVGIKPSSDTIQIGRMLGVQQTEDGFLMEAHPKLRPVDSLSEGIFIAGTCQAPKDIPDSVAQAKAAASGADNFVSKGFVEIEPYYSYVLSYKCSGCKSCISVCPYNAISFNPIIKSSEINILKCKGCGTCMITCPSGAIEQNHFTYNQLTSEVESLFWD